MPNKYSFNKSKRDPSEFLPENKDKKVVPKNEDFDLGISQLFREKSKGKNEIGKTKTCCRQFQYRNC